MLDLGFCAYQMRLAVLSDFRSYHLISLLDAHR